MGTRSIRGLVQPYETGVVRRGRSPRFSFADAARQSRQGDTDVLYLAWLLVMGVVGVASVLGVSSSRSTRTRSSDSRRSSAAAALREASRRPPTPAVNARTLRRRACRGSRITRQVGRARTVPSSARRAAERGRGRRLKTPLVKAPAADADSADGG